MLSPIYFLPADLFGVIGKKLPCNDLLYLRASSKWLHENESLNENLSVFERERAEQVTPLLSSLGIFEEHHANVLAELKEFREKLSVDFCDKNLAQMNNRATELLTKELPEELKSKLDIVNQDVPRTIMQDTMKLSIQVNNIKRHMVKQECMLAECIHYDINDADKFENSSASVQRSEEVTAMFRKDGAQLNHINKDHFDTRHKTELIAAHYSSWPSKMCEYTVKQHQVDFEKRANFIANVGSSDCYLF